MLNTASAIGTSAGSAARAVLVRTAAPGTTTTASRPVGASKRVASAVRADDEAAVQRGGDVVGMALELGGQREDVGVELEEMVGGHQAGHVGGGARTQPAAERDLRLDAEAEGLGVGQPGEAAHGEVAPVAGDLQVGVDAEAPGLLDLELHVERERAREGIEPGPEIRARGGHPDEAATAHRGGTLVEHRTWGRRRLAPVGRGRGQLTQRVTSPEFVGRERELAGLSTAFERAADGRPAVALVAGESGVGKTRLVAELAARARAQGGRVLTGDCVDLGDGELAYAPIVSALRGLDAGELGGAAAGLAPLLPQLDAEAGVESALSQGRVFELLLALLGRLAEAQPLVLVFEDVHWADRSSRDFLAFFVRNARHQRVLLVATYRTDELHRRHPLRALVAEAERAPIVERVGLERFTREEIVAQLTGILGRRPEGRLVDELFARTEGNPFFTEELAAAATGERLPANVADALMLRVEALSPAAQAVLRLAAVAGPRVSHGLLERASGLAPDELVAGLREAVAHNIVLADPETDAYGFRHALMREALADDLLPGERGPLHASLARALEADPALSVSPSGVTAELAFHWFAAHNLPAAFTASAQAGAEATRLAAFAEANAHYERAIELWDGVPEDVRAAGPSLVDLIRERRGGREPRRRVRAGRGARPPGAVARRCAGRPHDRRADRRAARALPVDQRGLARGTGRVPRGGRPPSAGRRSRRPRPRARLRGPPAPAARARSRGARALRAGAGDRAQRRRAPRGGQHPQHHVRRVQLHRRTGGRDRVRPRGHAHRPRAQRHRGDHARLRQPRRDAGLGRAHRGGG